MTARFIVGDVFDGLATLEDGTVDLVVTSPPFLALRSYLPADHPDKGREIGSEATPAEFLDVLLRVTAELRRVLAPHGSIAVELGDTYAGSGGAGGDYLQGGWRDGQRPFDGSMKHARIHDPDKGPPIQNKDGRVMGGGDGWPLAKSKTLIPELYRVALAYGINPLTGAESPPGRWRIRNVVTWCRPNPPVGALGDKWRPATSDIVVACTSERRYWDDIATRRPFKYGENGGGGGAATSGGNLDPGARLPERKMTHAGAPLLDYWELPPGGYPGSHYAVYPPALVEPLIKAMAPPKVCRTCGEPSRRIVERETSGKRVHAIAMDRSDRRDWNAERPTDVVVRGIGWTDCGHNNWRPALVLDPFAGSGTTLQVATGHGHDAIGIDLDERNYDLALERVGPLVLGPPEKPQPKAGVPMTPSGPGR